MSRDFDSTNVLTTLDVRQTDAMEKVLLSGFYDVVSDQLLKISLIARILLSLRRNITYISRDPRRSLRLQSEPPNGIADVLRKT